MNASFEEKSTFITLTSLLGVFAIYALVAGRMLAEGVTIATPYLFPLLVASALLVIILVVAHTVAAAFSRPEDRDERDVLIAWRAEHHSSWVLGTAVLAAVAALVVGVATAWIANGLLFGLFLSEIIKYALQLYYYRCGVGV